MRSRYDVIIVGSGVAGLFTALQLNSNLQVLLITKQQLEDSNSYLAQGGIAVLKGEEDFESYLEDTMRAGKYENNKLAVEVMINQSGQIIQDLIDYHVAFDRENGKLSFTREGAHSAYRILHHKDITGKEIMDKLIIEVKKKPNITIMQQSMMIDIIKDKNQCIGIWMVHNNELRNIYSSTVVLATGGVGGLFQNSTNFPHITGDGVAIATKNGVKIRDISYIQIHPTTLYTKKEGRRFLISEAVRGEGGILVNAKKQRFVDELLPRDKVSLAIQNQMTKDYNPFVYLGVQHLGEEKVKSRFPNIYKRCLQEGYDMTKDYIPVTPAQHYFMGGIEVDMNGQTTMQNLFAVGENSCNGVHGANRLASNSLLESLVFAKRAATYITSMHFRKIGFIAPTSCEQIARERLEKIQMLYRDLVLQQIKREDEKFYDRWCTNGYKCG